MNSNSLKEEYELQLSSFERLRTETDFILSDGLKRLGIKFHSMSSRIKTWDSFLEKTRRRELADPTLQDINDILGARVVCLFLSDIPKIGQLVRQEFLVHSEDNKLEGQDIASFGYMSVHFIVSLKPDHTGPRYRGLHSLRAEIQVRTIAMDAWASISHYLDYKSEADVPKALRRDFFALSGLFYVADSHFEMFFKERQKSLERAGKRIQASAGVGGDEDVNLDTLAAYLRRKLPDRRHAHGETLSKFVQELINMGFTKIGQLDDAFSRGLKAALGFEKELHNGTVLIDVGVARAVLDITEPNRRKRRLVEMQQRHGKWGKIIEKHIRAFKSERNR